MIVQPNPTLDIDDSASDTSSSNNFNNDSNILVSISDRLYKHFSSPPLPPPPNLHMTILHSLVTTFEVLMTRQNSHNY